MRDGGQEHVGIVWNWHNDGLSYSQIQAAVSAVQADLQQARKDPVKYFVAILGDFNLRPEGEQK
eukprot:3355859-Karenia_brevis.AAC.1